MLNKLTGCTLHVVVKAKDKELDAFLCNHVSLGIDLYIIGTSVRGY